VKAAKRIAIVVLVYIGIVVAFESMIGTLQPVNPTTLVITTTDQEGHANDRVLARLESQDQLYIAANHWPRAWYRQALENPQVKVALDLEGVEKKAYRAVPITGDEYERVESEHHAGIGFRILTGFPPRHFLRLDPE
jgi:hypothetical protein